MRCIFNLYFGITRITDHIHYARIHTTQFNHFPIACKFIELKRCDECAIFRPHRPAPTILRAQRSKIDFCFAPHIPSGKTKFSSCQYSPACFLFISLIQFSAQMCWQIENKPLPPSPTPPHPTTDSRRMRAASIYSSFCEKFEQRTHGR